MTALPTGPCVCDDVLDSFDQDAIAIHNHEHSDFEPFACVEPGCACEGHRSPGTETEAAENDAKTAPDARYRAALTIPAGALDFSRERTAAAAAHLDDVLAHHATAGNPDEPLAVLGLADLLEQTWPDGIDPLDVLALAIRRLADASAPRDPSARRFVADVKRRIERQRR